MQIHCILYMWMFTRCLLWTCTITSKLYHSNISDIDWHWFAIHQTISLIFFILINFPLVVIRFFCACGGVSFAHLRGHRLFLKAGIHCFTQFNCTVIPEPQTGFHIAFKMLDIDGNEHVDKKEFQKVWNVFSHWIIWHHVAFTLKPISANVVLKQL